jgi:hypothetical protein
MKLYEAERGSWFRIEANLESGPFKLDRIDGMYSLCWVRVNGTPEICHIHAAAEVILIDNPYETEWKCDET